MDETRDGTSSALRRSLGTLDLTCLVMGAIVGVGVFFSPRRVAEVTGSPGLTIAAWGVGGLIGILGALTFAELGVSAPETGGQYLVLRRAWGRFVAFLYGWSLMSVIQSGAIAIIAIVLVENVFVVFGITASTLVTSLLACLAVVMLGGLNILGVRQGAGVTNVTMIVKVAALLGIAALGALASGDGANAPDPAPKIGDGSLWLLAPALVPVLFSFGGWQQGLYVAGEVRNPARALPIGIIVGVGTVAALYVAVNAGYVALLGVEGMAASKTLAASAVGVVWGDVGERVCAAAVAVSALGILNVCIMTAPRMYKAMADDGCLAPGIAAVHPRFATPAVALLVQTSLAVALIIAFGKKGVDYMLTGVVCIDWVFFALTGASLFLLRRKKVERVGTYRALGYPVLPGAFVLVSLGIVVATFLDEHTREASVVAVWCVTAGAGIYVLFCRGR